MNNNSNDDLSIRLSSELKRLLIFILIISCGILSLYPLWEKEKEKEAFIKYSMLRLRLSLMVDLLQNDPCWKTYQKEHKNAKDLVLGDLIEIQCYYGPPENKKYETKKQRKEVKDDNSKPMILNAKVTQSHQEMQIIKILLEAINDKNLIEECVGLSGISFLSIHSWLAMQYKLMQNNYVKSDRAVAERIRTGFTIIKSRSFFSSQSFPILTKNEILNYIKFDDLVKLAEYQLPSIYSETIRMGKYGSKIENSELNKLPSDIKLLSVFLVVLLFILLVYTYSIISILTQQISFPVSGTFLHTISTTYWSLLIFNFLLWLPLLTVILIIFYYHSWILFTLSILIGLQIFAIHKRFINKGYFTRLKKF